MGHRGSLLSVLAQFLSNRSRLIVVIGCRSNLVIVVRECHREVFSGVSSKRHLWILENKLHGYANKFWSAEDDVHTVISMLFSLRSERLPSSHEPNESLNDRIWIRKISERSAHTGRSLILCTHSFICESMTINIHKRIQSENIIFCVYNPHFTLWFNVTRIRIKPSFWELQGGTRNRLQQFNLWQCVAIKCYYTWSVFTVMLCEIVMSMFMAFN